jgi:polyphosphate glucokinase
MQVPVEGDRILSIDIGGTLIKAAIINQRGELLTVYKKLATPKPATPELVMNVILNLVCDLKGYEKISVGFPGYVKDGVIFTCPQLGTLIFAGFNLTQRLEDELGKPARMINDADMQGLGVCSGKGFELVITLGTGLGSALLFNGVLLPHLELSQHPVTKKDIYDSYIGAKTLEKIGLVKWNKRVQKMLTVFKNVFNYDHLYIGGGNADKIDFALDPNITVVTNQDGIKGGARLWQ